MMSHSLPYDGHHSDAINSLDHSEEFDEKVVLGLNEDCFDIFDDIADHLHVDSGEVETQSSSPTPLYFDAFDGNASAQRKGLKRRKNFIPRVVKSDVRRHYGTMLSNILNSNCESMIDSFFESFAIPSFRINFRPIDPTTYAHLPHQVIQNHVPRFSKGMSIDGKEWFRFHDKSLPGLSPDRVLRLTDVRLVTRMRDRRSLVVMSTAMEMTQIYDIDMVQIFDSAFTFEEDNSPDSTNQSQRPPFDARHTKSVSNDVPLRGMLRGKLNFSFTNSGTRVFTPSSPSTIPDVFDHTVKLLPKPRHISFNSQMVLVIDEDKRIESLTMGNGNLPPDLLESLERKAAALSLQTTITHQNMPGDQQNQHRQRL